MPVPASRTAVRRSARSALAAAVAVVPVVGILAVSGAAGFPAVASSSEKTVPMTYDRDAVAALRNRLVAAERAKMTGWWRAVSAFEDSQRSVDRQRASRGEPRQALGAPVDAGQYWRPTTGTLTQPFHPGHKGIDIGVPLGTPVLSAEDGVVSFAGQQSGYGTHVEVQHPDGVVTTYSHLSRVDVVVGQKVKAGQLIAHSGNTGHSTGPHLHFEVHPTPGTLTDPLAWLRSHHAW